MLGFGAGDRVSNMGACDVLFASKKCFRRRLATISTRPFDARFCFCHDDLLLAFLLSRSAPIRADRDIISLLCNSMRRVCHMQFLFDKKQQKQSR